jgi:hypothetical protein
VIQTNYYLPTISYLVLLLEEWVAVNRAGGGAKEGGSEHAQEEITVSV